MRYPNPAFSGPYPTDPTLAMIGDGLGRALFGDPAARAQQQQQRAELAYQDARRRQALSAAGYDDARTAGVQQQTKAAEAFAGRIASLKPAGPAPDLSTGGSLGEVVAGLADAAAAEEAGQIFVPPPPPPTMDQQIQSIVPGLLGDIGQMQGDKVDPNAMIGALAAMLGGDGLARRGMVAQGKTPGEEFALTPERADDIRAQGYGAEFKKATEVARINHASDIPVAEIRARGSVDAAGVRASAAGEVKGRVDYSKANANARAAVQGLYPGARITQVERDPNSALGRANPGSYHNHSAGAVDVAPIPGMTFEQYVQGFRNEGYPVLEARNEVGAGRSKHATGDHWHVVLGERAKGKAPAAAKAPKAVPQFAQKQLDEQVAALAANIFARHRPDSIQRILPGWRARAGREYQRYGDVGQAMEVIRRKMIEANGTVKPKKTASQRRAALAKEYGLE